MSDGYELDAGEERELTRRAESGDASAAFALAEHFGIGRRDYAQYRFWLERAASLGHLPAGYNLGYRLMKEGRYVEARTWLERTLAGAERSGDLMTSDNARHALEELDASVRDPRNRDGSRR